MLHDWLRMIPPEKKRKWPEQLPEIVYAYNITPHSSTGYSPHLFFGREPTLPIDHLLGAKSREDTDNQMDEWVFEHQKRLNEAFEAASQNTEREAQRRRDRNDAKADDTDLPLGATVFCKNRAVKGRNKIQDRWNSEPHRVINRLDTGGHTYVVEPFDKARPARTVHRCELLDARHMTKDMEDSYDTEEVPPDEQSEDCDSESDDDFCIDSQGLDHVLNQRDNEVPTCTSTSITEFR